MTSWILCAIFLLLYEMLVCLRNPELDRELPELTDTVHPGCRSIIGNLLAATAF